MMSPSYGSVCLFGDGPAIVIGAPSDFDLRSSLAEASKIRMASAFAHPSGWDLIKDAFIKSKAQARLVTGLNFCQTDPRVLRAWLALVKDGRVRARLYAGNAVTFHPKVLIVSGERERFAIVGSANLSAGGFRDNVECSLLVTQRRLLDQVEAWFDSLFRDESQTRDLTSEIIKTYEPVFKKARQHSAALRKAQRGVQQQIVERDEAELRQWSEAISAAKKYFCSAAFSQWYPYPKKAAVRRIKAALRYPDFDFSKENWDDFYAESDLGRLRHETKAAAWKQHAKIQKGFRYLINDSVPIEDRLAAVLDDDGRFRATGVGLNIVSKVLVIHQPQDWSVYNKPVAETLEAFGYKFPLRMRRSVKYHRFCEMMREFKNGSGAQDMLALDCFFYSYARPEAEG